jgi:hypothetical protein
MNYFLVLLGGLPLLRDFFIALKTSSEYKLPLKIGSCLPRKILCATVLYGKPSRLAISSIVNPSIALIIGNYKRKIINVECIRQFALRLFSKIANFLKIYVECRKQYIDLLSNTGYI